MEKKAFSQKNAYESPEVKSVEIDNDILTESPAHDPNQGEWDTEV